jgi:ABC-2 type transport system ATP-binding protein
VSAAIEADGVEKRYGPLVAVADLTFSTEPGEILGVLGPNGAGKTTAIRVLTTILAPTRGRFEVAGASHNEPAKIRKRIGVLPESAGYPERQTGEEYLRYHARLYGQRRDSARAAAGSLLEEVGLSERAGALTSTYSRGMRQRLGIARALVNEPRVVFLDEPTLGLDPAGQRQVLGMIRRIADERGATVMLSTHLLAEVEETCSRVLILNQRGRVVAQGTVAEVSRRAAAPRTGTIAVPPQNVEAALAVLTGVEGVQVASDGRPGSLALALTESESMNSAVGAIVAAGIPLLSSELEGARLSDAFLAMTETR